MSTIERKAKEAKCEGWGTEKQNSFLDKRSG